MIAKLSISIPTYNRSQVVNKTLSSGLEIFKKYGIDVYIYDSSDNNDTYKVVKKFIDKGFDINYKKYDSSIGIDEKTCIALKDPNSEFVWLCGDAVIVKEDGIKLILSEIGVGYDILILDSKLRNSERKECHNSKLFFKDYCWIMTLYGASVVRSDILKKFDENVIINKYGPDFEYVCGIFDYLSSNSARILIVPFNYFIPNKLKKGSGWFGTTFETFGVGWIKAINELPNYYNLYKNEVIKSHGTKAGLFREQSLYKLRSKNVLNPQIYEIHQNIFEKITDVNLSTIKFIAFMPRWIAQLWGYFLEVKRITIMLMKK